MLNHCRKLLVCFQECLTSNTINEGKTIRKMNGNIFLTPRQNIKKLIIAYLKHLKCGFKESELSLSIFNVVLAILSCLKRDVLYLE